MSRLERLHIPGGEWQKGDNVFHVRHPHALTQAAGYLKYVLREQGPVLFRGQSNTYATLYPSLYRQVEKTSGIKSKQTAFVEMLKEARKCKAFIKNTPEHTHEPLLQHYGMRTRWLDLVDNIWIALWFACHMAITLGSRSEYLYFKTRERPYPDAGNPDHVYILLIGPGKVSSVIDRPGVLSGHDAEIIDLRVAAPSVYLRPHAQHGVLIKGRRGADYDSCNLHKLIVGVIRAELGDALGWLGRGDLLSVHTLFPPPHYDRGYRQLLQLMPKAAEGLGGIHHICP